MLFIKMYAKTFKISLKKYISYDFFLFDLIFSNKFSVHFKLILMHIKVLINTVTFEFSVIFFVVNTTKTHYVKFHMN